ncbi:hypothetical protein ACJIZ3_005967 [Penstemon smallii]|uniref:Myb/SANT-like domain-containing protein n=1 Tax=Penstemon smallii TaxID=265156 RepID=A0ABD3S6H9_9LAMI
MDSSSSSSIDANMAGKKCECSKKVKVQTSWTKGNPGRRFAQCGGVSKSDCNHMAKQTGPVEEVRKTADGWSFNENWRFMANLTHEAKNDNLNDLGVLNAACKRIATKMAAHFGRRYTKQAIKMKVEQMRARHNSFKKFITTPGVQYDIENIDATVTADYWKAIQPQGEPPMFKHFRLYGNPLQLMLEETFDEAGVASFPVDLSGSPGWPIHVRDSDEDDKTLVLSDDLSGMKIPWLGEEDDGQPICANHAGGSDLAKVGESSEIVGGNTWVKLD